MYFCSEANGKIRIPLSAMSVLNFPNTHFGFLVSKATFCINQTFMNVVGVFSREQTPNQCRL